MKANRDPLVSDPRPSYWPTSGALAYEGSWILMASSALCFFGPALLGGTAIFAARIAMIVHGVVSVLYHATGDDRAFKADIFLRNILGPSFAILEIFLNNNWLPALSGVFTELEHALLVHLPVMVGFFLMR